MSALCAWRGLIDGEPPFVNEPFGECDGTGFTLFERIAFFERKLGEGEPVVDLRAIGFRESFGYEYGLFSQMEDLE